MGHYRFDLPVLILFISWLVLLACLGILFRPFLQKHSMGFRSRRFAQITEPLILLLVVPLLVCWPVVAPPGFGRLTDDPLFSILDQQRGLWLVTLTGVTLACVLATRLIRSRAGVIMACIGCTLAAFGCLWWTTLASKLQFLHAHAPAGLFTWQWFVPSGFMALRIFAWVLIVVLASFYAVRHRFTWLRFIGGALAAGFAAYFILMPFWTWRASWVAVVPFTCLAVLLVLLPLQREALERLTCLRLRPSDTPVENSLPHTPEASYTAHAALILLGGIVATSAAVNYFEREQVRMFVDGPRHVWRSPALRNAAEDVKLIVEPVVDIDHAPPIDRLPYPSAYSEYLKLYDEISSETRGQIFASTGWEAFRRYNDALADYTDALEQASHADYMEFTNSATISYMRFQNLSKHLGIRSQLNIHEGRTLDGVSDIKTLYRLCGLLNDQPWILSQSIGFYSRRVANGAAYNALLQFRQDEQGLLALASAMDAIAPDARLALNWEAARRGESGMHLPIVPNADLLIGPSWQDVSYAEITHRNGLLGWINFDLVRMAVALELYKIQNGAYPDDPQEITPAYLTRLPLDAIDGKPYQYRITESGEYELRAPSIPDSWLTVTGSVRPFTFPLSKAGIKNAEAKKE
ncbi:MAG: hypothetical protein ACR2IE_11130 [Candidatus Sumerlaeaceae bacterium]